MKMAIFKKVNNTKEIMSDGDYSFQPCSFKENERKPKSVIDLFEQKINM